MKLYERVLTEGPGAGYEITGDDFLINQGDILDIVVDKIENQFGDYRVTCTCNLRGELVTLSADSYYYTTGEFKDIPIYCTKVVLYFYASHLIEYVTDEILDELLDESSWETLQYDIKDIDAKDLSNYIDKEELLTDIIDNLETANSNYVYGGGYSHSTYDGTITEINEGDSSHTGNWLNTEGYLDITANIKIDDGNDLGKKVIEFIDKAVQGENCFDYILVLDENDDVIAEFEEDEDNDAILYAESEEDAYKVIKSKEWVDMDGDTVDEDIETIWERD